MGEAVLMPAPVAISDWPCKGFKSLQPDHMNSMPRVTRAHLEGYFLLRAGLDQKAVADMQSLEKAKHLLDSRRVEACSFLVEGECIFLTALCKAAMKKGLSYTVKAKLCDDGEIINSHCECPSGMGPHGTCKHIAALLMTIINFQDCGSLNEVNMGCTDKLQNFHKPNKKYEGSPVKAEDLPGSHHTDFTDPRPTRFVRRPGQQDHFRNTVINFSASCKLDITGKYAFAGTHLQHAVHDHDYLKRPFTEEIILKRIQVTSHEASVIEQQTHLQSKSEKWFQERKLRLTASRFGEICHLTSRRNMEKFCQSLYEERLIVTPSVTHGKMYEKVALAKFEKAYGVTVKPCGLFIHPDHPFLAATPDGLVGEDTVVEVKCPYTSRDLEITPSSGFPFLVDKDDKLSLKKNHLYYDQVQGQLFISKRKLCYFVIFTKVSLSVIEIARDDEYCTFSLIPKLQCFFDTYYLKYVAAKL